jgi:hypothetical protein
MDDYDTQATVRDEETRDSIRFVQIIACSSSTLCNL